MWMRIRLLGVASLSIAETTGVDVGVVKKYCGSVRMEMICAWGYSVLHLVCMEARVRDFGWTPSQGQMRIVVGCVREEEDGR